MLIPSDDVLLNEVQEIVYKAWCSVQTVEAEVFGDQSEGDMNKKNIYIIS